MTKRKATVKEAQDIIKQKIKQDGVPWNPIHLQIIMDNIYPYTWGRYCDSVKCQRKIKIRDTK